MATAGADTFTGKEGLDWVSYAGSTAVTITLSDDTATVGGAADGDTLTDIQNLIGSEYDDTLTGNGEANALRGGAGADTLNGGAGRDRLDGGKGSDTLDGGAGVDTIFGDAGADTYVFRVGDGTDTITDIAGDTMTLRFEGSYADTDFAAASDNFNRVGNDLVITIDKDTSNTIIDKVTISDAYDTDPNTGTGNAAFTINIQYGAEGSDTFTDMTDFWSVLAATT